MTTAFLAGIALGLASSAHCAAMCGPLVLTIGRRFAAPSVLHQLRHALLHHGGRLLVYALMAVVAGMTGEWFVVNGAGRALAVVAGVLLLAAAAAAASAPLPALRRIASAYSSAVARAAGPSLRWARGKPIAGPIATGAMNGILPCGLVYAALAAAAATGNVATAVALMGGFGIGTAPVLIAMTLGAASLPARVRLRLRPLGPVVLAVTAAVILVRGVTASHAHPPAVSKAPMTIHTHH
jgi:sulfite exporter TauE/SafE